MVTLVSGKLVRGGKADLWLEQSWNLKGISCWEKCEVRGAKCREVVTMDQHSSVETLLSKAEIPIIDLSYMGKWSVI